MSTAEVDVEEVAEKVEAVETTARKAHGVLVEQIAEARAENLTLRDEVRDLRVEIARAQARLDDCERLVEELAEE
ncbi:hypothetical protein [Halosegnis marinus]|uniref:Cell division protein ZapB n=1 Tax=Halosegnis marinus TaxID=3034023 RepID=A0ABD5ZMW9_9EURY|nr:hypothetical protein [Halosegnis sp. DT85]